MLWASQGKLGGAVSTWRKVHAGPCGAGSGVLMAMRLPRKGGCMAVLISEFSVLSQIREVLDGFFLHLLILFASSPK